MDRFKHLVAHAITTGNNQALTVAAPQDDQNDLPPGPEQKREDVEEKKIQGTGSKQESKDKEVEKTAQACSKEESKDTEVEKTVLGTGMEKPMKRPKRPNEDRQGDFFNINAWDWPDWQSRPVSGSPKAPAQKAQKGTKFADGLDGDGPAAAGKEQKPLQPLQGKDQKPLRPAFSQFFWFPHRWGEGSPHFSMKGIPSSNLRQMKLMRQSLRFYERDTGVPGQNRGHSHTCGFMCFFVLNHVCVL